MSADLDARAVPCPTCHAVEGEKCAGLDLGSHGSRVDEWQRASRGEWAVADRQSARSIIAAIRAERGWKPPSSTPPAEGA